MLLQFRKPVDGNETSAGGALRRFCIRRFQRILPLYHLTRVIAWWGRVSGTLPVPLEAADEPAEVVAAFQQGDVSGAGTGELVGCGHPGEPRQEDALEGGAQTTQTRLAGARALTWRMARFRVPPRFTATGATASAEVWPASTRQCASTPLHLVPPRFGLQADQLQALEFRVCFAG